MLTLSVALLAAATTFVEAQLGKGGVKLGPAPTGCSPYEILVARGTGEPGPFGSIVGDPLVRSITSVLPGSRGYAVQYPASNDFIASTKAGINDVINRLNKQNKACPDQKYALVGYSQGAGVMHGAVGRDASSPDVKLDKSVYPKIVALVMFGDPGFSTTEGMRGTRIAPFPPELFPKVRENCAAKDPACDPSGGDFSNHLKYRNNPWQNDSIAFILAGFRGKELPKAPRTPADLGMKAGPKGAKSAKGAKAKSS